IFIHDSTTECEDEGRASVVQMEEKAFVSRLHSFMKEKGTPIERIPHLGFKQINLWKIYKAVDKLGGYDSVTARRLWKKVYDELGGSPGSTSAATCTRRHYERLVLPFERNIKGEEDKPLPPSKPRKPYKRNLDAKMTKRSPESSCQNEAVMPPHSALWADRHHSEPNRATTNLCTSVYAHLLQVPTSSSWIAHLPSATGEVISPLEKKKRVAQASLNLPASSQSEDKERPSVIHCSLSPARASFSRNCNSSDGSPLPLSSSSSRSPSPYSVSSEDSPAGGEDKPVSSSEMPQNGSVKNPSGCSEDDKTVSKVCKDPKGQTKDVSQVISDPIKSQVKDSASKPIYKGTGKYYPHSFHPSSSFPVKPGWVPTSTSSFTKVIPKSSHLLRPTPVRPSYKIHQGRLLQQDDSCAKKVNNLTPWPYQTEKREKSRTMQQKIPPNQQSLFHSAATLPVPCGLSGYDKSGRDSRHQPPLHPAFFPNRMRLPHSQLMYRHVPLGPPHSALIGSALYPYPYPIPLLNPPTAYALPAMNPIYSQKL
uniref:AT-rich interactive domain 5A n=1 Tax=Amphilophus citrinellus TaxID=61819 RepID=A0A3Q0SM84_AMPCI